LTPSGYSSSGLPLVNRFQTSTIFSDGTLNRFYVKIKLTGALLWHMTEESSSYAIQDKPLGINSTEVDS
tara:strand:- start:393 stop:599 length:207 start_codon:yes stop_codon:yes gene_type:complete